MLSGFPGEVAHLCQMNRQSGSNVAFFASVSSGEGGLIRAGNLCQREVAVERQEPNQTRLTAGDVSRALKVDLKTVHNWVQRGLLHGSRTPGGHLRFLRTEVIRFLRRRGRMVPSELAVEEPTVVLVGVAAANDVGPTAERHEGVFDALLGFGTRSCDVIVVGLDQFDSPRARELASALCRQPTTQGIAVIGVSADAELRRSFLAGGADLALPSLDALPNAIEFVTGRVAAQEVLVDRSPRPSGTFARLETPPLAAAGAN